MNNSSNSNKYSEIRVYGESYDYERVMKAFKGEAFKTSSGNQQKSSGNQQKSSGNQQKSSGNQC